MSHIFIGILIVIIGFMVVWKTEWFLANFGRSDWADQKLGFEGGSHLLYKLIGVGLVFIGLFVVTNIWNDIMAGLAKLLIHK